MNVVMAFIAVNRCATTLKDHTSVSVLMAMNSTVMDTHAVVRNGIPTIYKHNFTMRVLTCRMLSGAARNFTAS